MFRFERPPFDETGNEGEGALERLSSPRNREGYFVFSRENLKGESLPGQNGPEEALYFRALRRLGESDPVLLGKRSGSRRDREDRLLTSRLVLCPEAPKEAPAEANKEVLPTTRVLGWRKLKRREGRLEENRVGRHHPTAAGKINREEGKAPFKRPHGEALEARGRWA